MSSQRILVVEDDAKVAGVIRLYLEHAGFAVDTCADGATGLAHARATAPALVVLDIMLPGMDGLAICRALRETSDVPVLLVTARSAEEDRLAGLDVGADDYIVKPFSPRELVARVRAVLRRRPAVDAAAPPVEHAGVALDPHTRETRVRGELVALTVREFALLGTLLRAPGRAFSREELVERAFGDDFDGLARTIDAHVRNLRRKIEADPARPALIETVPGVGYRFARRHA